MTSGRAITTGATGSTGTTGAGAPLDGAVDHAALARREAAAVLPTYGQRPATFVRGEGPWLYDADGRAHLDFLCGLAVTSLGHAHPRVTAAVTEQVGRLVHTSNLFYTEPQVRLAERLKATLGWPDGRAFFANSGAEANEAAIKLARRHGKSRRDDKVQVVAVAGGFHGRTLGALLATGNPAKHAPFAPLGEWVTHVPRDDVAALRGAVDDRTCAIWVEIVQGEGGVRPASAAWLAAAREEADRVGALLVVDEVQTGIGRLGAWYGWQTTDVVPDVVCLAKALANGLPIGAVVARGAAADAFAKGDHATTFGGGPVVCAAALAVLDTIAEEDLVTRAATLGAHLSVRLARLGRRHGLVAGVRGRGLLQALVLTAPVAAEVTARALEAGLIVNAVAADAVRLAPPLIVTEAQVDDAVGRLDHVLSAVSAGSAGSTASAGSTGSAAPAAAGEGDV